MKRFEMRLTSEMPVTVRGLGRGRVVRLGPDAAWVSVEEEEPLACDVLGGGGESEPLRVGDEVMVALPGAPAERGCVLGRVESWTPSPAPAKTESIRRIAADRLLIEAGTSLEIRVGESRIMITEKGDIVLTGNNLLSRARRVNKIRGAAVNIN
ncbi:MAG: hypothetical protein DMF52_04450 [Acidobacteria bacterium]|nr:MAG: hypothetical protein DMF52_04450 [Acidobacteriota bacterium]